MQFNGNIEYYNNIVKEWCIDEIYPILDEDELNEIKSLFGNRETGILHRGMSINNEEELEQLKNFINNKNKSFNFNDRLVSATPDLKTAISFMNYQKSYDPSTQLEGFKKLKEIGVKSEYGTALITFKIKDKSQVVFKNYHEKNEENLLLPEHTSESEVLFHGEVELLNVKILEPINKENYIDKILNVIENKNDLYLPSYNYWIKHNISKEERDNLNNLIIKKLLKTYKTEELLELFFNSKDNIIYLNKNVLNTFPKLNEFIKKNMYFNKEETEIYIKLLSKDFSLYKSFEDFNFNDLYKDSFTKDFIKIIKNFKYDEKDLINTIENKFSFDTLNETFFTINRTEQTYKMFKLINMSQNNEILINALKNNKFINKNVEILRNLINDKFDKNNKNKYEIKSYIKIIESLKDVEPFLLFMKEDLMKVFEFSNNFITTGPIKNQEEFQNFPKLLSASYKTIIPLLGKIDQYNKIEENKKIDKKNHFKKNSITV